MHLPPPTNHGVATDRDIFIRMQFLCELTFADDFHRERRSYFWLLDYKRMQPTCHVLCCMAMLYDKFNHF